MRRAQSRNWKPLYARHAAAPEPRDQSSRAAPKAAGLDRATELGAIAATKLEPGECLKIEAWAGAGKSTALLEIAKANPELETLYVVFNVSVQEDQAERYESLGLDNVTVRTLDAHAFKATLDIHDGNVADHYDVFAALDGNESCPLRLRAIREVIDAFVTSADLEMNESHCKAVEGMSHADALNYAEPAPARIRKGP